jgi:hypothetical protein
MSSQHSFSLWHWRYCVRIPGYAGYRLGWNSSCQSMQFVLPTLQTPSAGVPGYPWTLVFVLYPYSSCDYLFVWRHFMTTQSSCNFPTVEVDTETLQSILNSDPDFSAVYQQAGSSHLRHARYHLHHVRKLVGTLFILWWVVIALVSNSQWHGPYSM